MAYRQYWRSRVKIVPFPVYVLPALVTVTGTALADLVQGAGWPPHPGTQADCLETGVRKSVGDGGTGRS